MGGDPDRDSAEPGHGRRGGDSVQADSDQQTATKWEITNDHSAPLRADMDEKHERVMTALASLRDDMNGEFKTVNERVSNAEREHLQLREDIRELRRSR